jgi:hypothetical protein
VKLQEVLRKFVTYLEEVFNKGSNNNNNNNNNNTVIIIIVKRADDCDPYAMFHDFPMLLG